MKLPARLRVRSRRQVGRTVEVTLTADTTKFVEAMERAAEGVRVMRYRERIAHERSLGLAYVGTQLDQMCRDLGLDPVATWRLPRAREERDRRDQAALAFRLHVAVGLTQQRLQRILGEGIA